MTYSSKKNLSRPCPSLDNRFFFSERRSKVFTLHTPHFTLHSSHSKLQTSHSTLHTSHFTVHTSHFSLLTASFTLQTSHFTLHTALFALQTETSHSTLHTSHSTLLTSHFPLLPAHFTLHTALFTPHTSHCSKPTCNKKTLVPKWRKSANKSRSQLSCSHSKTIYEIQLQKTIVFPMQPQHEATLTQPLQCDLQRLSCKTQ